MSDWATMDARPRRLSASVREADIPGDPGVYAFYRDGHRLYVGKATSLRGRLWDCHLRRGVSMTNSAFRRNVAEHLGIASADDIKRRRYTVTANDAARVSEYRAGTELAWIVCERVEEAEALESTLKREYMPPLTKR